MIRDPRDVRGNGSPAAAGGAGAAAGVARGPRCRPAPRASREQAAPVGEPQAALADRGDRRVVAGPGRRRRPRSSATAHRARAAPWAGPTGRARRCSTESTLRPTRYGRAFPYFLFPQLAGISCLAAVSLPS